MSYSLLADETIVQILNFVHSTDIVNFARVNAQTYRIAFDRYKKQQALDRNAKVMTARFGPRKYYSGICMGRSVQRLLNANPKAVKEYDEAVDEDGVVPDLDYLELNEDLHWLRPLDSKTMNNHGWDRGQCVSKGDLDKLVASGERVGITFPPSFLAFMGSTELIESMYLGGDFFCLEPSLVKYADNHGGGYLVRFLSDQQSCCFWTLYLAPGGYRCVLNTGVDPNCYKCAGLTPGGSPASYPDHHLTFEANTGIVNACESFYQYSISQAHPNFEYWLAMKYFNSYISILIREGRELTGWQKEYLEHFWPKE